MSPEPTPVPSIAETLDGTAVEIIDQTRLPHDLVHRRLDSLDAAAEAIRAMRVRGAPLIGVTAAYGMAFAVRDDPCEAALTRAAESLRATRPTGVNLRRTVEEMTRFLRDLPVEERAAAAWRRAGELLEEDAAINRAIGEHGYRLLRELAAGKAGGEPLHILTHCNAGALATVAHGTATAPIYRAHAAGVPLHVWVDETRPRNQGAALTAWELAQTGVPHTVIVDNAGGHLMQRGQVDVCLVGTDRTTARGDVCNKIGTYLKALAAHDTGVPFYAAVPGPSIDWTLTDSAAIPIEERDAREVAEIGGRGPDGRDGWVRIVPDGTPVANYGFDVTPARLVTGLITERGICTPSVEGLRSLYPERA